VNNTTPAAVTGDHDEPYTFGLPVGYYLNTHDHARLVLLRSQIDTACRRIGRRETQGKAIEWNYTTVHSTGAARTVTVEL